MRKIPLFLLAGLLLSCQKTTNNTEKSAGTATGKILTADKLPFPCLTNTDKTPFPVNSFLDGKVSDISTDELGLKRIVVDVSSDYYWEKGKTTVDYKFIYGGMDKVAVKKNSSIKTGDFLGQASKESYITVYKGQMDNFLLRMTSSKPKTYKGEWYFSPDWIVQGHTAWLSFRPVDDFGRAVTDFYNRWKSEGTSAEGSTIHYFPDKDRIRAKIKLSEYPAEAQRDEAVGQVEKAYYQGKKVFVLETKLNDLTVDGHSVIIYWQRGYDRYLKEAYSLNDDLYIYASIYAIDHDKKQILVFARDFSNTNDQDIVKKRLAGLMKP